MRSTKIALVFAIAVSSSNTFAAVNPVVLKLAEFKAVMVRSPISRMPSLNERIGLTQAERDLIYKKYSPEVAKSIELSAGQFWSVDLLKALAAAGETSFHDESEIRDEWLSRIDVSNGISGPGMVSLAGDERIQLTFLSSEGFVRIENSQELVHSNGRDLIAGIPAADFCERNPGSAVPVDYALKFSPWDVATRLASSSRLEASLVNLILKPDALAIDQDIIERPESGRTSLHAHEHGWSDMLDRVDDSIKKGALKLVELANITRRDASIEQSVRSLILAAAVTAPPLRKNCENNGGIWSEMRWGKGEWLDLFACRTLDKKQLGYILSVEDGDLAEGSIKFSTVINGFKIEARLDAETEEFSVRYFDPSKSIDSEIWYTKDGAVLAAQDGHGAAARRVGFDQVGQVVWKNQIIENKTLRSLSWYSNGVPKGFDQIDANGQLIGRGGFHKNGSPKFWQPYLAGKKDGKLIWWFPNGSLAGEIEFVAGKRFGVGSVYYENGVEGFHAEYAEDLLHGRMVWRDPSRRSIFNLGYTSGKAHGLLEIRHGGRTIAEARFHGGAVEGAVIVRNEQGLIVGEIPYQAGLLDGVVVLKDSSGLVRVSSSWDDGQLDGDTEVWYASRAKAAYCKFDDGHLVEWASFRPDGAFRYVGRVESVKEGRSVIDYYAGAKSPNLRCKTSDWSIDQCDATVAGKTRPSLRLIDFAKPLASNDKFTFKPEKCGGYSQSFDVSPFTDLLNGNITISFRVKGPCKDVGLATSIRCQSAMNAGNWSVDGCESTSATDQEF